MNDKLKLGETLYAEGKVDLARQAFLDSLSDEPDNQASYNNLGVIAIQSKRRQDGIDYFMKSLGIDPGYMPAVENLCQILEESGNIKEAIPLLEPLAEKRPQDVTVRKLLLKARRASTKPVTEQEPSLPADARSMYRQAASGGQGDSRFFERRASLPDVSHKIAILCLPGLESFLKDIVTFLGERHEIKTVYSSDGKQLLEAIKWSEIVWLEWANDLAVTLTSDPRALKGKRVICRLHSYEAFSGFASTIKWEQVDDLIFVGEHIREHVLRQVPDLGERVSRIHVVPTGVDLDLFPLTVRQPGKKLAYLGYINYKKGPMLLLHAFSQLVKHDSQYQLSIAGRFQDDRYSLYFNQMARELGLERNLHFDGWVDDVSSWLEDKQYIVSSSVLESQGMGILEGMARGLKPIVHNFVGAQTVYPRPYLWSSIDDFVERVTELDYDSVSYREFVTVNYPLARQMTALDCIIRGKTTEKYRAPLAVTAPREGSKPVAAEKRTSWQMSEGVFSTSRQKRIETLVKEAGKQLNLGEHDLAEVSLERLARMTLFSDENVVKHLASLYQRREDIPGLREVWKRSAVAALEKGNLDQFLERSYISIYAENLFSSEANYLFCDIDQDLNAYTRLIARSHPLHEWVQEQLRKRGRKQKSRPKKLRVGFVLEGFSQNQAASRTYFPIAENYDSERYELTFYSRWFLGEELAKQEKYEQSVELFKENGCSVRTPPRRMSPIEQVEFLAKNIVEDEIDILVFQTTSFVPQYNFLSCLHTAPFQAAVEHQQPEYSAETDLLFTTRKQYPESLCATAPFVMAITRDGRSQTLPSVDRAQFGIPREAVLLTSVNRALRYSQPRFWTELERLMTCHSNVYFMPIGLKDLASVMPERQVRMDSSIRQRIITPGFRTDVLELLQLADIYVDLFPSGGGSSLIEAMQVGLPVPCFEDDYAGSLFNLHTVSLGPTFVDTAEMIVPPGDYTAWHELMDRLIIEPEFRTEIGKKMIARATEFEPEKVVRRFFEDIERGFMTKMTEISKSQKN